MADDRSNPNAHFRRLERMYATASVNAFYDPSMRIEGGAAEVAFTVTADHHHAAHFAHGSVYFKAMDDAAFFAAQSVVEDAFIVTVSFTVYFTRPVAEGVIRARGRLVHASSRLLIAEAVVEDEQERVVARGHGTFMPSSISLSNEVGYGAKTGG